MMKRALLALLVGLGLMQTPARAGIVCTLPNVLVNGTVADATQVMANFNAITACLLGNIAASGANNDITGLFALTTPIAPINGGTPTYIGSNSGGTANAQTISTVVPSNFTLSAGRSVLFFAGLTNNAAMTLDVAGSGAINVFKRTATGVAASSGGEVVANQVVVVTYDGTNWVLQQPSPKAPTFQIFTSGTNATYTNPGASWIELRMVGGGGGGGAGNGGAGGAGNPTCWNSSGTACVGPLYQASGGGAGGGNGGASNPGGGTAGTPGCDESHTGQVGGTNAPIGNPSGAGGGTWGNPPTMPTPPNGNLGIAGAANTGAGGSGGSTNVNFNGSGGSGGGACVAIITNPAATYVYTVGTGGAGGTGGGGFAGGAGGTGWIKVIEHYQ